MKTSHLIAPLALIALGASCSGPEGWSVEGTVALSQGPSRIAVEGYNNGIWYPVDSIDTDASGHFSYKSPESAAYPEIMRLSGAGLAAPVFFPVDGNDAVKVEGAKISGTPLAEAMSRVDSIVADATSRLGAAAASDLALRRELGSAAIADSTSILAYYILNKSIAGKAVFNPKEPFGNRIYGAVAQNFAANRPDDPRGNAVKAVYLEGRLAMGKAVTSESPAIEVPATGIIDITRFDDRGQKHSLAELASQGKVIVLSFTAYQSDFSPAYSVVLNDAYEKYHDRGLEIFQIAFDRDEVLWKEAARNLPWITVYNAPTDGVAPLSAYNVGGLPATFVINRQGDIHVRVDNPQDLEATLAKMF